MAEMEFPLALVTGAAHRLGRAFAVTLARAGYAILLHYNSSAEEAASAGTEIQSYGVPVYPLKADLTNVPDIDALFSYLDTLSNPLRILVNSAAVMPHGGLQSLTAETWDSTLALNLRAPFLLAQRAASRMTAGGLIVNITDAGAGKAWTGYPAYIVSKAGLETLTHLLARALAPSIRVNAIGPGLVLPSDSLPAEDWDKLVARLPLKHSAGPEEVASALLFLLRNESITGQTIVVDGGYSLL